MPVNTPRWITVDPDGHTLSVTITKGGDAVHAYARDGGGNDGELRASPMTVAAPTTFWFRASGQYEVSMLLDGHEVASDSGARTVALSTGGKAVKPSADALRKAVASELPTPTADDAGKALVVNEAGDAFELGEAAGTSVASWTEVPNPFGDEGGTQFEWFGPVWCPAGYSLNDLGTSIEMGITPADGFASGDASYDAQDQAPLVIDGGGTVNGAALSEGGLYYLFVYDFDTTADDSEARRETAKTALLNALTPPAATSVASVMALIATVNGYNLFAGMVTVEAGTVPSYEGTPPGDQGWFLYAADTPLSEAGLSGSAAYNSDDAHPAGTFIAEFYADAANPAPTALPDGWTPASPLIALAALEARVAALETP